MFPHWPAFIVFATRYIAAIGLGVALYYIASALLAGV